ncbi:unnamed protein product [Polarella glacialis]|nr:unnamed protein product [Polarella glacialis]
MIWNKTNRRWTVHFHNVKAKEDAAAGSEFDELLIALYTPRGIFVFRHDLRQGLTATGVCTAIMGSDIFVYGPCGETSWPAALDVMLQKLDASACQHLAHISLNECLLAELAGASHQTTGQVYNDLPLADLSSKARGDRLQALVREVDSMLHPDSAIEDADSDAFGWLRGHCKVKCKSAQLRWCKVSRRWKMYFQNIKLQAFGIRESAKFDQLLLAMYTPRGVYVYRHDLEFAVSTFGVLTAIRGHTVQIAGPRGERKWQAALKAILNKFDAESNGCKRLAVVPFRRLKG